MNCTRDHPILGDGDQCRVCGSFRGISPSKGDGFAFTHNEDKAILIDSVPRVAITLTTNECAALRWTAGGPEPIFGGVILGDGDDGRWCLKLNRSTGK